MLIRALHPWLSLMFAPDEGGGGGDGGSGGDGGAAGSGGQPQTFTQEQVNDLIAREKGKFQSKYGDYDELKAKAAKLAELENASKSDLERLTGERDTLKGQTNTLTAENQRLKVALKKGLVGDKAVLAERLTGSTEAELEADADKLLELFGGTTGGGGFDGGARGNGQQPASDMDSWIRRAAGRST
jgi:hypothetical protein